MPLSPASELVLQYHRNNPKPAHAVPLIGKPGIPDQDALTDIYGTLVAAKQLDVVYGMLGRGISSDGQLHVRTLYQLRDGEDAV
jgi:hypothetical protein